MAQLQAQLPQMDEVLAKELSRLNFSFCVADCTLPDCPIVYASQVRVGWLLDGASALEGCTVPDTPCACQPGSARCPKQRCSSVRPPGYASRRVMLEDSSEKSDTPCTGAHMASHGWL